MPQRVVQQHGHNLTQYRRHHKPSGDLGRNRNAQPPTLFGQQHAQSLPRRPSRGPTGPKPALAGTFLASASRSATVPASWSALDNAASIDGRSSSSGRSSAASNSRRSPANGVRSWCDASAVNARSRATRSLSRRAVVSSEVPTESISAMPERGVVTVKFPAPNSYAALDRSSNGRARRRACRRANNHTPATATTPSPAMTSHVNDRTPVDHPACGRHPHNADDPASVPDGRDQHELVRRVGLNDLVRGRRHVDGRRAVAGTTGTVGAVQRDGGAGPEVGQRARRRCRATGPAPPSARPCRPPAPAPPARRRRSSRPPPPRTAPRTTGAPARPPTPPT